MTVISRRLHSSIVVLVLSFLLAQPASAVALGPNGSPEEIYAEGFESSLGRFMVENMVINGEPGSAYWGRRTNRRYEGVYGLWCAGTPSSVPFGDYPIRTRGAASVTLGELDQFFSSNLAFRYLMPSLGDWDSNGFSFNWYGSGAQYADVMSGFPITSTWTQVAVDLSDPDNDENLSRRSGDAYFQFYDTTGEYTGGPWYMDATGEGPTVDDIRVTGYRYGPVRELAASGPAGSVELTWSKPYARTEGTAVEDRSLVYRVYRRSASGGSWTELTASPTASTSFTDYSAQGGVSYEYAVQAWDAATGSTHWGELGTPITFEPGAFVRLTKEADADEVVAGDQVTWIFRVENLGSLPLTDVVVHDPYLGSEGVTLTLSDVPANGDAQDDWSQTLNSTLTNTAEVTAMYDGSAVSDLSGAVTVTVYDPSVVIDVSASETQVGSGQEVTLTYEVYNTGDLALDDLVVTDSVLGQVGTRASLAAGSKWTFTEKTTFTSTRSHTASVAAVDSLDGTHDYADSDQVTVQVVPAAISITSSVDRDSVTAGDAVEYTYVVENVGSLALDDVTVTDDPVGTIDVGTLSAGAQKTVSRTVPLYDSVSSAAKVTGAYDGVQVSDTAATLSVSVASAIDRFAGADRVQTAVLASKQAFPDPLDGERAVVLASAAGWADALPASALAGTVDGPLLLVDPTSVPSAVLAEMDRLGATKAYIVGGTGVVSTAVGSQLASAGYSVERVWGTTRYGTAKAVADTVRAKRGTGGTAFVATGVDFPDALAASSLAAAMEAPIVLTLPDTLPAESRQALDALDPDRIVVCGGTGVVSTSVQVALGAYAPSVVRKAGANRYDTAKAIIEYGENGLGLAPDGPSAIFIATGTNYPDALAGGVLAGTSGGSWNPLMLTDPLSLSPQASSYITANPTIDYAGILGGTGAVSETVRVQLGALIE